MATMENEDGCGERKQNYRRPSILSQNSEYEPLLVDGLDGPLYQTISQSHAEQESSDTTDVETADTIAPQRAAGIYTTLSVLLLGVFVSQTDQSFVLATYGAISSEFDDLSSGFWLVNAYTLASCVAQPLYGKMSDIYGRKACLQTSYFLFTLGTAASGLGQSMGQVITGRVIQGAGSAGMISMVSIIITDLVPLNEVASLWSYVNILQTTGRSCGGFIGGLLTQSIGWRLAFLVQVPPMIIAILLAQWRLHLPAKSGDLDSSRWDKLKRVDFIGAIFLCYTIFTLCFILDAGGQKYPWDSPILIAIMVSGAASAVSFVITAKRVKEPIFPLRLIVHYELITNYLIVVLQIMVQMSMMMSVPLYFQSTKNASTGAGGAYLVPAFIGNTLGGLLSGYWIRKTGRYKWPTVFAPILSILSMILLLFLWNGDTSIAEAFYILPGGIATGMISSSAFVGMAAGVQKEDVALAGSAMYLFFNIGAIGGASSGAAAYQRGLQSGLRSALQGVKDGDTIYQRLLDDIKYLWTLSKGLRDKIMPAYVQGFHRVIVFGLVCASASLLIAIFTRGRRLPS